jgi:hypothetical protein
VVILMSTGSSSNSSAVTPTNANAGSYGANAYGGSWSLIYVGAFAWSFVVGSVGQAQINSTVICGTTFATRVSLIVNNSSFVDSLAFGRTLLSMFPLLFLMYSEPQKQIMVLHQAPMCVTAATAAFDFSLFVSMHNLFRCKNKCVLQVYGGAISLIIGSYSWCQIGPGWCIAQAVDTYCIDCAASLSEVVIFNSTARSNTWSTQKIVCPSVVVYQHNAACLLFCNFWSLSSDGASHGAFVRALLHAIEFVRLSMMMLQVYGGALSFSIGAYIWSTGYFFGGSSISAGATVVSGIVLTFRNNRISNCLAESNTIGGMIEAPVLEFCAIFYLKSLTLIVRILAGCPTAAGAFNGIQRMRLL